MGDGQLVEMMKVCEATRHESGLGNTGPSNVSPDA